MTGRWPGRVYSYLCGFIGITCFWFALEEGRRSMGFTTERGILLWIGCVFFITTSLTVFRRLSAGSWLAGASGGVLIASALSLSLVSRRGVVPPGAVLPVALSLGAMGLLGVGIAVNRLSKRPVTS